MSHPLNLQCFLGIFFILFIDHAEGRSARIIGGAYANEGQFPYHVAVQYYGRGRCGGTILTERFVVTAAHCVINATTNEFKSSSPFIVAGIINLYSEFKTRIEIDVVTVYVPKVYDSVVLDDKFSPGDIAILELRNDLDIERNSKLGKVKLPENNKNNFEDKNAIISGFGTNSVSLIIDNITGKAVENKFENDYKLRFAEANMMSNEECEYRNGGSYEIPEYGLCAAVVQRSKREPEGVCTGDSGGGLIYNGTIIGILSSSPNGCRENVYPATYTRVSHYLSFINNVLNGTINNSIRTHTLAITS